VNSVQIETLLDLGIRCEEYVTPRCREQSQVLNEAHARLMILWAGKLYQANVATAAVAINSEDNPSPPPPRLSSPSQSNSVNSYLSTAMPFKQLSLPVALVALVVLLESPLALASKNVTRWRNFAQNPSSSDFTVSFRSGPVPPYLYDADDGLGVRRLGPTQRYVNMLRPSIGILIKALS